MVRTTRGRQKIQMVKMDNESNLQVTFSKRRSGLFKKASELSTLCGVELAILVFSPGDKAFSFGHPNVDSVVNHFLHGSNPPQPNQDPGTMQLIQAHRNANVNELNLQMTQLLTQLEVEKKHSNELKVSMRPTASTNWWELPIGQLSPSQLEQLRNSLEDLRKTVEKEAEKILIRAGNPQTYHRAGSSQGPVMPFDGANAAAFHGPNTGFNPAANPCFNPSASAGLETLNDASLNVAAIQPHAYNNFGYGPPGFY